MARSIWAGLWASLFGSGRKSGRAAEATRSSEPIEASLDSPQHDHVDRIYPAVTVDGPLGSAISPSRSATDSPPTAATTPRFEPTASPYPIVTVHGRDATATWERLRGEGKGTPVVVGDDEQAIRVFEAFDYDQRTPQEIVAAALSVRFPDARKEDFGAEYGEEADDILESVSGDWPESEIEPFTTADLTVSRDILTGEFYDRVHIVLLPTQDATEAPAYLRFGGWNECPSPEVHVAALRSWRDRYGAVIAACSGDIMELQVERPPTTRADAMALATEQFLFCTDIVLQGTETIPALAQGLVGNRWWYFWWD